MTTAQKDKIARRKLSLLQLSQELGNVSKACKIMGYSRQQFYEIRRNFQTYGAEGLIDRLPGPKGPHPNRVSQEIEDAILAYSLEHPSHGAQRTADDLVLSGVQVSSSGVRGVWSRHNLLTKHERLLRLEETAAKRKLTLTEEQIRLLERYSPEFRRARHPDPHCALRQRSRVLRAPRQASLRALPPARRHRAPDHQGPQASVQWLLERFHRTLLDEHLRVKGRTTWYESVEEMQTDLDEYLERYNTKRPHRGRKMNGKTPFTVFKAGIPKALKAAPSTSSPEEDQQAA